MSIHRRPADRYEWEDSMAPLEELRQEHQIILKVLHRAMRLAAPDAAPDTVTQIVDFLQHFADRCHHGKEEKHLFTLLAERGMSFQQGPLAVMMKREEMGEGVHERYHALAHRLAKE
jgi:hemerythrin-like domain-containing protein